LSIISVGTTPEPIRAPYHVTVHYDLRPALCMLSGGVSVYLAALDTEKLRRKGSGMGIDVLQASESFIARDCLCSASGKLKQLTAWKCPGQVRITLCPSATKDLSEACVLLRVVAVRRLQDPHDWRTFGAGVVLRVDTVGTLLQADVQGSKVQRRQVMNLPEGDMLEEVEDPETLLLRPEFWGVRLQQLVDFRDEIREDMWHYCSCHRLCMHGGRYKSYHVCLSNPCTYRPIDKSRFDDHRGVPFISRSALEDDEVEACLDLDPNMNLVVERYIKPATKGTGKSHALLMNPKTPLRIRAYISHAWGENFIDLVDTLVSALDKDDVLFLSSFAFDQHATRHQQNGGSDAVDARPFAQALREANKLIVVVDKALNFAQRFWCGYEIKRAQEWLIPTFLYPHRQVDLVQLKEVVDRLDVRSAVCSDLEDEKDLRETVDLEGQHLEAVNRRLRDFLYSRIRCYASSMQQAVESQVFSLEKLRRIHAEQERRFAIEELDDGHRHQCFELDSMQSELDQQLAGLHCVLKAERQQHRCEIEVAWRQNREAQAEQDILRARAHNEMQEVLARKDEEIDLLYQSLQGARAKIALLEEQLEQQRQQAAMQSERVDQERRRADDLQRRAEDGDRRLEEEQRELEAERRRRQEEEIGRAAAERRCGELEVECRRVEEARDTRVSELLDAAQKEKQRHVLREFKFAEMEAQLEKILEVEARPLKVVVVGAKALLDAQAEQRDDAVEVYCVCEIKGRPKTRFQTATAPAGMDLVWNITKVINYNSGDELVFSVYDKDDQEEADMLGSATVQIDEVVMDGFDGLWPLKCAGDRCPDASLVLVIEDASPPSVTSQEIDNPDKAPRKAVAVRNTGHAAAIAGVDKVASGGAKVFKGMTGFGNKMGFGASKKQKDEEG